MKKEKDLAKITDYKSLVEVRKIAEKHFDKGKGQFLFLCPKNEYDAKSLFDSFVLNNKNTSLLHDDTILKSLFKNYESMSLELCVFYGMSNGNQLIQVNTLLNHMSPDSKTRFIQID